MKIIKQNRTQADIVLAMIQNRIDDSNNAEWRLDTYNNGRERGYVLELNCVDGIYVFKNNLSRWIAFSENRNSDDTVIYTDCGYWDGRLTEKSYKEAKYFSYSKFIQASDYIIKVMENSIEDVRETRKEKEQKITK